MQKQRGTMCDSRFKTTEQVKSLKANATYQYSDQVMSFDALPSGGYLQSDDEKLENFDANQLTQKNS